MPDSRPWPGQRSAGCSVPGSQRPDNQRAAFVTLYIIRRLSKPHAVDVIAGNQSPCFDLAGLIGFGSGLLCPVCPGGQTAFANER
jgi:hypothetical protein